MSGIAPRNKEDKLTMLVNAWFYLAKTATFYGLTLDQFKLAVKPSLDARGTITSLDDQLTQAIDDRDDADKTSMPLVLNIVNSIKGDPNFGEDSALYEACGYVRKSERVSGKTNKTKAAKPA